MENIKYTIISIATGSRYLRYWQDLVVSLNKYVLEPERIRLIILTDKRKEATEFCKSQKLNTEIVEIPPYKWPEATLLRYQEIYKVKHLVNTDYCIYLDADMLVLANLPSILTPKSWINGIALVLHPGYWRPKGLKLMKYYFSNPRKLASDLKLKLLNGGLGAWEKNPQSHAFVHRAKRRHYVCGGAWFGATEAFFQMVEYCQQNVRLDLEQNYIAIWHDESHLNKWSIENNSSLLPPSFCFDPDYSNLRSIPEYIRAIKK